MLDLYEFIDWLLALPETLEDAFLDEIHDLEAMTKMRYITSAERIGMRRGHEQGMQQGMQQGVQQGVQQGMALTLRRQLRRRFGEPPAWVEAKLREGTPPQLERWADQLLDAETLEAVFEE